MPTDSIQFSLDERFAAPLPEFFKRRIVFSQDEDYEFEAIVNGRRCRCINSRIYVIVL